MLERISISPTIYHGKACIKGTSIPVCQIVSTLTNGNSIDDLLYLKLTQELREKICRDFTEPQRGIIFSLSRHFYNGILQCFLGGFLSTFVFNNWNAFISLKRVSEGIITSSIKPLSAAT